ncbi:MAG TPA: type II toxin-antitoxin system VapC family toxin [Candidatus Sulfotelmatobacter sp.]|nr:type II toxin-antitoxin system VapC family toxin [Candidatus Sulfotelmatobacter sp.]
MTWLLDTNALSELSKPHPNPGVTEWFSDRKDDEARMFVSALSLAEIYRGVHLLAEARRARLRAWALTDLPARFAGRIISFDEPVARTWGAMTARLPKGVVVSTMDSLIAATAVHHGLTLVTRNVRDVRHFADLSVECPWR